MAKRRLLDTLVTGNSRRTPATRHGARGLLGRAVRTTIDMLERRQLLANPVADLGGPYNVNEGASVVVTGAASTDDGSVAAYEWDLNYRAGRGFKRTLTGRAFTFHAEDGNATRNIALRVTDNEGNTNLATGAITVHDVAPTLGLTGAATGDEGAAYSLAWSTADVGLDTITGFSIDWGDDSSPTTHAATASSATHTYAAAGEYTITLTATDEDGTHTAEHEVTIADVVPTITLAADASTVNEGQQVRVTYGSPNRTGTIEQWIVDWGDDSINVRPGKSGASTHTYADSGVYTVTVTALEPDGTTTQATTSVTVTNVAPVLTMGSAPATSPEGTAITVTKSVTDAGSADTFSYAWSLKKNGVEVATSTTAGSYTFTPTDNGAYTITLTVSDDEGATDSETRTVDVTNVAPTGTVAATQPMVFVEGDTVHFTSTLVDPGSDDGHTYLWKVEKDGEAWTIPAGTPIDGTEFDFTPTDDGSYIVSLLILDDDGGAYLAGSSTMTVINAAPDVVATRTDAIASPKEGDTLSFLASAGDDGSDDELAYAWTVTKDGAPYAVTGHQSAAFSFVPTDNGTYVATVTVTDDDGGTTTSNAVSVTVGNAAPTAAISGPAAALVEGNTLAFTVAAADAGSADTLTYAWSVTRDGAPYDVSALTTDAATFAFVPVDQGTYVVSVIVTDDDAGTVTQSTGTLVVTNAPPTATLSAVPVNAHEGDTLSFTATASDVGGDDDIAYLWTVTRGGSPFVLAPGTVDDESAFSFVPTDEGSYVVHLTVTDNDGASTSVATAAFTVENVAPIGTVTGTPVGSVDEGTPITLGVTAADAGSEDGHTYLWSVERDGVAFALPGGHARTGSSFTFTPTDDGDYVASVVVSDGDGGQHIASSGMITVGNVAPTATIAGTPVASVDEGDAQTFTASPSDVASEDTFSYAWSVKKGGVAFPVPSGTTTDAASFTFTPTDNGSYVVSVVVSDDDAGSVTVHSSAFTVANVAPTTAVEAPTEGAEGSPLTFASNAADVGTADVLTYAWTVTKDGAPYALPGGVNVSNSTLVFTPDDDGTYVASVTVTDDDAGTVSEASTSVAVANVAPTPTFVGMPTGGNEGSAMGGSATVTDPAGANDTITYAWSVTKDGADYDLGGTTVNAASFSFTPVDNGEYVIKLTVSDGDGGTTSVESATITVANVAPTATITGEPGSDVNEGDDVTLTVSAADAGVGDVLAYAWSVKKNGAAFTLPGGTVTNAASFTFTPTDDGTYVASVVVTDGDGGSVTAHSDDIVAVNVNPTGDIIGEPVSAAEGSTIELAVTAADDGTADTFTYAWTVTKDGASFAVPAGHDTTDNVFNFVPTDNGSYVVSVVVTDDNGGSVTVASDAINVTNAAPDASISGPTTGSEGAALNFSAAVLDPGALDTHTYAWTVTKNGVSYDISGVTTNGATLSFTPNDEGTYVATVVVNDDDGATDSAASASVAVANVAPAPTVTGGPNKALAAEGSAVTYGSSVTDAGSTDTVATYAWSVTKDNQPYSVGGATTNASTFTFTPEDNGAYVVSVTVTDNDGGTATATKALTVKNVAPVAALDSTPTGPIAEGDDAAYAVTVDDLSPVDTFTYAWTVTRNGAAYVLPNDVVKTDSTFTFSPTQPGTYVVTANVADDDGGPGTTFHSLTVTNVDPIISAVTGPTGDVNKNDELTYNVSAVDPGSVPLTYTWTVSRGDTIVATETGATLEYTPTVAGDYSIEVSVSDGVGFDTATATFTAVNHAPAIVAIEGVADANEGETLTFTGTAEDPDGDGVGFSWVVTRGEDVVGVSNAESWEFVPADDGEYTLTLTVTDGSETDELSQGFSVANVAPVAAIEPIDSDYFEGNVITIGGSGTDVGADDTLTYAWTVQLEGSDVAIATSDEATITFTPTDDGAYVATLTVSDGTAESTVSELFEVASAAPHGEIAAPTFAAVRGFEQSISIEDLDLYEGDTATVDWNWGDGTTTSDADPKAVQARRWYATGTFNVTATITDDDGSSTVLSRSIEVRDYGMQADPMGTGTALVVAGTSGADVITFNKLSTGKYRAYRNGVQLGNSFAVDRIYAYGDGGVNLIAANANVTVPVIFYGGSSKDTLVGGSGNDMLMGRRGNDSLLGGAGRDILVGGADNDALDGGEGEDVVIAGSFNTSETIADLAKVAGEWGNTGRSFNDRVTRLRNGASGLAAYFATGTVIRDGKVDSIAGGNASDWLYRDVQSGANDSVVGSTTGDRVDNAAA